MAQLSHPTPRDWVSQVLEEIEDLSLNLEIEEIEVMKKVSFKKMVKEAIRKKAFSYLLKKKEGRNSENAKGRHIKYEEFVIAEYLIPSDEVLSIEDKKWLFKCRVEDIEIKGNHRWKHNDITCSSCQKGVIETQVHLLYCETLLGQNENVTYIPAYKDLYSEDLKDQSYVSRLLKDNFDRRISEE